MASVIDQQAVVIVERIPISAESVEDVESRGVLIEQILDLKAVTFLEQLADGLRVVDRGLELLHRRMIFIDANDKGVVVPVRIIRSRNLCGRLEAALLLGLGHSANALQGREGNDKSEGKPK